MVEFIVCFGSDDEKKENKRKKNSHHKGFRKESDRKTSKRTRMTIMEHPFHPLMTAPSILSEISFPHQCDLSPEAFPEELDYNNIEYKLKLTEITAAKLEKRITQMQFRLKEGHGLCIYRIGVEDSGNPLGIKEEEMKMSIEFLMKMTAKIGAAIEKIRYMKGIEGYIAEVTIAKQSTADREVSEVGIGLLGEEDSGKSTLVGCLLTDKLDNGKGMTRTNVFRHRHEINCGKTSSFTHQILGFDKEGNKTNVNSFGTVASWSSIVERSDKIVNLIDMGGSERSLSISLRTLSPNYFNYIFLVISAKQGLTDNSLLFLKLALILNVPVVAVLTKIDQVNKEELNELVKRFNAALKAEKKGRNPLVVKDMDDVVTFANNMNEGIMPIFLVSNTTGCGLGYLNYFLSLLPASNDIEANEGHEEGSESTSVQFDFLEIIKKKIENINQVIVEGIVSNGMVKKSEKYLIGPFNDGKFEPATVLTIHSKKIEVNFASQGQFCSVELQLPQSKSSSPNSNLISLLRPGMALLDTTTPPSSTMKFTAELRSLSDQPIMLKYSYQPIVHLSHISQCAKISSVDNKSRGTDTLIVSPSQSFHLNFQFLYHPEFFKKDMLLIIMDNHIKLYGYVKELIGEELHQDQP